jgi:AmiR/NasT family two-component response regulator
MEFHPVVVEQAKGFLREVLDISVEDAYNLLRRYAQADDYQLTTRVSKQLITEPDSRPAILAAMRQMLTSPPDG